MSETRSQRGEVVSVVVAEVCLAFDEYIHVHVGYSSHLIYFCTLHFCARDTETSRALRARKGLEGLRGRHLLVIIITTTRRPKRRRDAQPGLYSQSRHRPSTKCWRRDRCCCGHVPTPADKVWPSTRALYAGGHIFSASMCTLQWQSAAPSRQSRAAVLTSSPLVNRDRRA